MSSESLTALERYTIRGTSVWSRCIKLGGETDSAIRRRKITGVTSPRGSEKAGC